MNADVIKLAPGQGVVYSRALPVPVTGWVPQMGAVKVMAEREMYGHVFQKEVIQLSTGMRGVVDAKIVFHGENILPFPIRARSGKQAELFSFGGAAPLS